MLNKLTKEQEAMTPVIRDEFVAKLTCCKPLDREAASRAIDWLYKTSGLKAPIKIVMESPLAAQLAANLLSVAGGGGKQVAEQVWQQVAEQVGQQIYHQVRQRVGQQVYQQVRLRVEQQVGRQVWGQVEQQVEQQVWEQKLELHDWAWYGRIDDVGWCSFYDFFRRCGVVKEPLFDEFLAIADAGIYDQIQFEGCCIIASLPEWIDRDAGHRLHSVDRMAIRWRDGWGLHYLHGVYFEPELWAQVVDPKTPIKEILAIKNMEQRRAAVETIGIDKVIDVGTELDSSARGNRLIAIDGLFDARAYYLTYTCPSTGRRYVSGVDPAVGAKGDADECMAWKLKISPEMYRDLRAES